MARFIASQCTQLTTSPATLAIRAGSTGPTALPRPTHPVPHAPVQLCRGRFLGRPAGFTSPGRRRGPVLASGSAPGHESFELSRYIEAKVEHGESFAGRLGVSDYLALSGDFFWPWHLQTTATQRQLHHVCTRFVLSGIAFAFSFIVA